MFDEEEDGESWKYGKLTGMEKAERDLLVLVVKENLRKTLSSLAHIRRGRLYREEHETFMGYMESKGLPQFIIDMAMEEAAAEEGA